MDVCTQNGAGAFARRRLSMVERTKVLVVEDNVECFYLIKDLLLTSASGHYEVSWASGFEAGLVDWMRQDADIYLIDCSLGDRTGLELLDSAPIDAPRKPVILMTRHGSRDIDVRAMEKGVSNFLPKSELDAEILERSIRYGVKRAREEEQLRIVERSRANLIALEKCQKERAAFLANLSHELRTPLNSILGYTELALECSATEQDKKQYLAVIRKNGLALAELIDDFLDLSKVEAGRIDLHPERVDLKKIVADMFESFRPNLRTKHVDLSLKIQGDLATELFTDEHLLRQVLRNLLCNAVKFTECGSITVLITQQDGGVRFQVDDTGLGISAADRTHLFQPFARATSGAARKIHGSGLGLCLSRKLAESMGGTLKLAHSSPRGSCFVLEIPDLRPAERARPCGVESLRDPLT